MSLQIVRNDITKMAVDAIVNTANLKPIIGTGVDTAIHTAAGPQLLTAREKIGMIPRGSSAITLGFNLRAKYVIHTVGTRWRDGYHGEIAILRSCYLTALKLAAEKNCRSIAFPVLATGNFGYPKDIAMDIAHSAFQEFLYNHENMDIYLVVFSEKSYLLSKALFNDVKSFINETRVEEIVDTEGKRHRPESKLEEYIQQKYPMLEPNYEQLEPFIEKPMQEEVEDQMGTYSSFVSVDGFSNETLKNRVAQADETFHQALQRMVFSRGLSNKDVYCRVFMSKQRYNNIFNHPENKPTKNTALLLAIALELNLNQTLDFIGKAGYTLSDSNKADIIVKYFIEHKKYNVFEIDAALYEFGEKTLASMSE